jgi:ribonuclease J
MQKNIEIANTLGFLDIKEDLIIKIEDAGRYPNKKLVVIGTGTQGEPMSALARMAFGTHRHFTVEKGDTVIITASVIPGNERMVTNIVNSLMEIGADVYYDKGENIHVSCHGASKEFKMMIAITKPKFFMPIHGEYKQLKKHAGIAELLNIKSSHIIIAKNGDVLELTKKTFKKVSKIPLLEMYVDGAEIGDIASDVIKERHLMSTDGIFYASMVISQGMLLSKPEVVTKGFISNENTKIHNLLQKDIEEKLGRMLRERKEADEIEDFLKKSLKNYIFKLTRRNPLIVLKVIEV